MADPVVDFVSDWIAENVTPGLDPESVDLETVQEHFSLLLAEARDEGISEEDIDDTGLDVPSLIEAALGKSADDADEIDGGDSDDD